MTCYEEWYGNTGCRGQSDVIVTYNFTDVECQSAEEIYGTSTDLDGYSFKYDQWCDGSNCEVCSQFPDRNGDAPGLQNMNECYGGGKGIGADISWKIVECSNIF